MSKGNKMKDLELNRDYVVTGGERILNFRKLEYNEFMLEYNFITTMLAYHNIFRFTTNKKPTTQSNSLKEYHQSNIF